MVQIVHKSGKEDTGMAKEARKLIANNKKV